MNSKRAVLYISVTFLFIVFAACSTYFFRSNYDNSNALLHETENLATKPFLKAHLNNGDVCILQDSWLIDSSSVTGQGTRYDYNRDVIYKGQIRINIADVAIFETNTKLVDPEEGRVTALTVLAGLDVIAGVICLTTPKACFGSCPTFYLNPGDNFHYADAEGFSAAITPSLEYGDIDALNKKYIKDKKLTITMKNEALETHCVNSVQLLAYPVNKNERVFQSSKDSFYLCQNIYPLKQARCAGTDASALLKSPDRSERFSLADKHNLSSKEEIVLYFEDISDPADLGLVIHFRQTLMTTFFIYSALGYMGDQVGDLMAKLETDRQTRDNLHNGFRSELGNIDVYLWNEETEDWHYVDGFFETGPIAFNRQILPLKNNSIAAHAKLKLVLNKGLWRIDYLALTNIKKQVTPDYIRPDSVITLCGRDNNALEKIASEDDYLLSMPGDSYEFNFTLAQDNQEYELFLHSKGYYLEWMRSNWIKDKDLFKLWQMVEQPGAYLKSVAEEYSTYEEIMEKAFWNSRIDSKTFSLYEN